MIPTEALVVDRRLEHCHQLVQMRWPAIKAQLEQVFKIKMGVNETARAEIRQQWLYGAGRTREQCLAKGIPADFARPAEKKVTNAYSAATSAHGWKENGVSAACALDVVPLGPDEKPWTPDDEWDPFLAHLAVIGPKAGLVHFTSHGKVTDMPHLQLVEWSDREHRLIL